MYASLSGINRLDSCITTLNYKKQEKDKVDPWLLLTKIRLLYTDTDDHGHHVLNKQQVHRSVSSEVKKTQN